MPRRVFETPWFAIDEFPSCSEWNLGTAPFYQLTSNDHAVIVPVTSDGQLLMVRQFRPARNGFTLEFPAGGVDAGESPLQAAQRELLEETGLAAEEWVEIGRSGVANQREAATCNMFAAFGIRRVGSPSEKGIETLSVTAEDIRRHVLSNEMDMLVTMGVLFFAKTKLRERLPAFW